jgi:hypothetical protein
MIGFNKLGNHGHLANQMFQYAAVKGIANKNGYEWCIPPKEMFGTSYDLRSSIYDCFKLKSLKNIGVINSSTIEESHFHFDENLFNFCPDNINLMGYFQTEKYFKHIKKEIFEDFEIIDEIKNKAINFLSHYKNSTNVSIHLRRTDYIKHADIHIPPTLDYYSNAMSMFDSATFFVFSDDIEWCQQQEIFQNKNVVFPEFNDKYIDFSIMSLCDHNIIANSSYSWWASYLNTNSNKKIIAPSIWFGFKCNLKDLYMDNWTILQS